MANPDKPGATKAKYELITENEQRYEAYQVEDADYVFVAFGLPSRTAENAVDILRAQGEKVGIIRPITVWPFPYKAFEQVNKDVKGFISVESTDAGQLVEDVALAAKKTRIDVPIYGQFTNQHIPKAKEVVKFYEQVKAGQMKEVF